MNNIIYVVTFITCVLHLSACSNAITYHHSERNSIALEAKQTDPQQPIQGVIGIKTRTVVVTPGLGDSEPGESASVISDFKLQRDPGGFFDFGKTSIQSAFITGDAAIGAPASTAAAVGGLGSGEVSNDLTIHRKKTLQNIYNQLKTMASQNDTTAGEHVARLDKLSTLLPDISANKYYQTSGNDLIDVTTIPAFSANFQGVIDFEEFLRGSLAHIENMENNRVITYAGNVVSDTEMKEILKNKKRIEGEREEFFKSIGNSAAIDSAALYVIQDI